MGGGRDNGFQNRQSLRKLSNTESRGTQAIYGLLHPKMQLIRKLAIALKL
jgi:hypothetical protein